MNNKAQGFAAVWLVIITVFFLPFWAFFLGPQLSTWGAYIISANGLTGLDALFWGNLNFLVFIAYLTSMILGASVSAE